METFQIMDYFNIGYEAVAASIVTIIILIISTKYLRGRISNTTVQSKCKKPTKQEADITDEAGTDGDDETEGDDTREMKDVPVMPSPRYPDPVDYCEHIQGEFKRVQQSVQTKSITESLTDEQLEEEREVQRKQLAEIFQLMQDQQDRFGVGNMDDMQKQMRLYAV